MTALRERLRRRARERAVRRVASMLVELDRACPPRRRRLAPERRHPVVTVR